MDKKTYVILRTIISRNKNLTNERPERLRAFLNDYGVPKKDINILLDIMRVYYFKTFVSGIMSGNKINYQKALLDAVLDEYAFEPAALLDAVSCWIYAISGEALIETRKEDKQFEDKQFEDKQSAGASRTVTYDDSSELKPASLATIIVMPVIITGTPETYYGRLLRRAQNGDIVAANLLGDYYIAFPDGERDYISAANWYTEAAEQGEVHAQLCIGALYHEGNGVPQNLSKAFNFYRRAAHKGLVEAQYRLGYMFMFGFGTEKNIADAIFWIDKAAEQEHPKAELAMGVLLSDTAFGVRSNYEEAYRWFYKSSRHGCVEAYTRLANCYRNGIGTVVDLKKAAFWEEKAGIVND